MRPRISLAIRLAVRATPVLLALSVLSAAAAFALGNIQAADGLKEALVDSTTGAVKLVGHPGGYFDNQAIKILLPSQLKPVESGLRAIGMGPQIDKFVLSMNRAA